MELDGSLPCSPSLAPILSQSTPSSESIAIRSILMLSSVTSSLNFRPSSLVIELFEPLYVIRGGIVRAALRHSCWWNCSNRFTSFVVVELLEPLYVIRRGVIRTALRHRNGVVSNCFTRFFTPAHLGVTLNKDCPSLHKFSSGLNR
jgi:hypothetical protein